MSEVIKFLSAVLGHWQGYVTGGIVTGLIYTIERLTEWKMPRWMFAALSLGIFLLVSFFLAWRDQYREALQVPVLKTQVVDRDKQISDLKERPPQIQVSMPPVVFPPQMAYVALNSIGLSAQDYRIGGRLGVLPECKNISASVMAENVSCDNVVGIIDSRPDADRKSVAVPASEDDAWGQFIKATSSPASNRDRQINKRSLGPNETSLTPIFSPVITEQIDQAFRDGTKVPAYLGRYSWEDGTGKHTYEVCKWLQMYPGFFAAPGVISPRVFLLWQGCEHHNGLKKK